MANFRVYTYWIPNTCNSMSSRLSLHCLGLLLLVIYGSYFVEAVKRPNIVFIITDDQDLVLGGMVSICIIITKYSRTTVARTLMTRSTQEWRWCRG